MYQGQRKRTMQRVSAGPGSLTTLPVLLASDEASTAKSPVPEFLGHGERIAYLCDLSSEVKKQVCEQLGVDDVAVGFFYQRFQVCWLDVWTWGGIRVLFTGRRYWNPRPEAWQAILGKEASDSLRRPFLYRFPLFMVFIGSLVLLGIPKSILLPSMAMRAPKPLKDVL